MSALEDEDLDKLLDVDTWVGPRCDCCDEPTVKLVRMDGVDVADVDPGATRAQIHAAPRRPALWCHRDARAHETWKRSRTNAPSRAWLAEARP